MVQSFGKNKEDFITLTNPVNPECPLLRDSFLYQFLGVASKNAKFFDEINYFDTGKIWTKNEPNNSISPEFAASHLDEQLHVAFLMYKKSIKSWKEDTLLESKSVIDTLLHDCELNGKITYELTDFPYYHPKKQGKILFNKQEI
jgi:phenylalanyl-tRNA synthetase beta subunit